MAEVNQSASVWTDELARLVANHHQRPPPPPPPPPGSYNSTPPPPAWNGGVGGAKAAANDDNNWRLHAVEFAKGLGEMTVEFGKGMRDVLKQSILRDDSFLVKKVGGPCRTAYRSVCRNLRFLNEYLPEDRDPAHAWTVIAFVLFLALIALFVSIDTSDTSVPLVKKLRVHPPSAARIFLPDGRYLAYKEQGVPAEQARISIIASHSFLSSRLAGIPGIRSSLLEEFGVHLITYDLPGFGESDPHPNRNLESSALDVLHLSYGVNITDKFWVLGFSDGSIHTWAALRYIPDRIAGAIMVAPLVNPYEPSMTKEERRRTWASWTSKKKLKYFLARKFPALLPYYYRWGFLSGYHGQIDKWLSLSLSNKDRALMERPMFKEFWLRNVEESVRQGKADPFVEEAVLQVSNWGFRLADLKLRKKPKNKSFLLWVKSLYRRTEENVNGFLGPIHIWQGMEDKVVPPSMSDFASRVLPDAMVQKLLYEGHFTYLYFCDDCHRQIFTTAFGAPQGPLAPPPPPHLSPPPLPVSLINMEDIKATSEEEIPDGTVADNDNDDDDVLNSSEEDIPQDTSQVNLDDISHTYL